jgi:antitoxin (DNA-binding transcriptional repressor) of toxin-antitoxin stability system
METQIIGIKELHKQLKEISEKVLRGESFLVVKNSKPVFRIESVKQSVIPRYTLKDLKKAQFKGQDKNLSKKIDKIVYNI